MFRDNEKNLKKFRCEKELGSAALNVAGDIAKDVATGKNFSDTVGTHINTGISDLKTDIEKKLKGGKRKRKIKKSYAKKRRDIFTL